jgi:hypothetical protein
LNEKDIQALTIHFESKVRSSIDALIMADNYLIKKEFLRELQTKFHTQMEAKAQDDLSKRNVVLAIKTGHAYVGGIQNSVSQSSTESKSTTKSKSKAKKGGDKVDTPQVDETMIEITFIDRNGLVKELKSMINEISDELIGSCVEYFLR